MASMRSKKSLESKTVSVKYLPYCSRVLAYLVLATLLVVAMAKNAYAWQPGKDGAVTITTANTVINNYYTIATNLNIGDTTVTLNNVTGLSTGDILMIYQAQGATINATDAAAYGTVTALNNAGNYEFVSVRSIAGNTVTINTICTTGLRLAYTATGKIQAVRVPQYSSLTVSGAGTIVATAWNGTSGGIVAAFVQNTATISVAGGINVSNQGFRGGGLEQNTSAQGAGVITTFRSASGNDGAEKGEGIAGSVTDYDSLNGRYSRGAPANGGGGGNGHNAGGGGGSNGNNGVAYTGTGNPNAAAQGTSTAIQTAACWNLEAAGFATSTSSGGGRGGYTYAGSDQDATTLAPGSTAWGGDQRDNVGGFGGRPLTNNAVNRLFFGGGGGAGDSNNSTGTPGGLGGGLIFLLANSVTGGGSILANGQSVTPASGRDGPGGGGGGGSIVISGTNSLSLNANGGIGGSQNLGGPESEGPGGGGGGGFIGATGGTQSVLGGANGTTNSSAVTEFIHNGATAGAAGNAVTGPAAASLPLCRASATLRLAKAWAASSVTGNIASLGPTAGLANNTVLFTSTAPTNTNGASVNVVTAEVATLPAETMTTGTLTNYNTTVACTGGTLSGSNGQVATNTLTVIPADQGAAITCTYTNTRATQTLQVVKVWTNAVVGHTATVTTTGGTNNSTFSATAPATGLNGTTVNVFAGDVVTLPAETFGGGAAAANYNTTLVCAGGSILASGAVGRTVTITNSTTATVCTYANALRLSDLAITKTDGVGVRVSGSTTVYTIRVTNNGPDPVTGALLSDPAATGLTVTSIVCSATPGQCTGPTTPSIVQLQTGNFPLPTLGVGQFFEINVTATVVATGF
jgi:large repetitive protein